MITITNSKLESFTPKWARFHGFSILFDNPGENLRGEGNYSVLVANEEIGFYAGLSEALSAIGGTLLTNTYLFAPLPFDSYHVTVWDGINDSNLSDVEKQHQGDAASFINRLPHSIASKNIFYDFIAASPLLQEQEKIVFRFDTLYIWDKQVLVAALRPTEESIIQFNKLKTKRDAHNGAFAHKFRVSAFSDYCPHVSLGYFANQELAQLASTCLHEWRREFSE